MGPAVARVGVHRARRALPHREVIGVTRVDAVPVAIGRLRHDRPGPNLPDDSREVSAQLEGRLDATVGVREEVHVVHTDDRRRGSLLVAPQLCHLRPRDPGLGTAGITVGDDAIRDVDPGVGHHRHRTGPAEIDVVGMGRDHKHPLDTRQRKRLHYRTPSSTSRARR